MFSGVSSVVGPLVTKTPSDSTSSSQHTAVSLKQPSELVVDVVQCPIAIRSSTQTRSYSWKMKMASSTNTIKLTYTQEKAAETCSDLCDFIITL